MSLCAKGHLGGKKSTPAPVKSAELGPSQWTACICHRCSKGACLLARHKKPGLARLPWKYLASPRVERRRHAFCLHTNRLKLTRASRSQSTLLERNTIQESLPSQAGMWVIILMNLWVIKSNISWWLWCHHFSYCPTWLQTLLGSP